MVPSVPLLGPETMLQYTVLLAYNKIQRMCKLKFKPSANNCWTTAARRINYPLFPLRCCSRIVVSVVKMKRAATAIVDQIQASCFKNRSSASLRRQPARRRSPIGELRVEGRTESLSQSQIRRIAETFHLLTGLQSRGVADTAQ